MRASREDGSPGGGDPSQQASETNFLAAPPRPARSAALRALTDASSRPRSGAFCLEGKRGGFSWAPRFQGGLLPGDSALALPSSLPAAQGARPGPGQPVGQRAPTQWVQGGPWAAGSGSKPGPWPWPQRCAGHRVAAPWALETDDGGESTVLPPRCELSTAQCRLQGPGAASADRAPRWRALLGPGHRPCLLSTHRIPVCFSSGGIKTNPHPRVPVPAVPGAVCPLGPSACCLGCTSGCQLPP